MLEINGLNDKVCLLTFPNKEMFPKFSHLILEHQECKYKTTNTQSKQIWLSITNRVTST